MRQLRKLFAPPRPTRRELKKELLLTLLMQVKKIR